MSNPLLQFLALLMLPGLASTASFVPLDLFPAGGSLEETNGVNLVAPSYSPGGMGRRAAPVGGGDVTRLIVGIWPPTTSFARTLSVRDRTDKVSQRLGIKLRITRELGPSLTTIVLDGALDADALAATLTKLQTDPEVQFAEVDQRRYVQTLPNDPLYGGQWHLQGVETSGTNLEAAWDTTNGAADTVIAVVDTGIRFEHLDLTGRVLPGYDFVSGKSSTSFVSATDAATATVAVPAAGFVKVLLAVTDDVGRTDAREVTLGDPDTDGDGVSDASDNCTLVANASQCDSDGDNCGNACDGDLNNNVFTNSQDYILFRALLGRPSGPSALTP